MVEEINDALSILNSSALNSMMARAFQNGEFELGGDHL
jgi:hypothetical protein